MPKGLPPGAKPKGVPPGSSKPVAAASAPAAGNVNSKYAVAPSIDWFHANLAGKPYGANVVMETRDNINFGDIGGIEGGDTHGKEMDDLDVSALSFINELEGDGFGSVSAINPVPTPAPVAKAPTNPDEPDLANMTMAEQLAWNATQLGKKPKRVIKPRDPMDKPESEMTMAEKL